jgi:hypothetical protein
VGHRTRKVHTLFGWIEVSRAYYHCGNCKTSDAPYDRTAGLGSEQTSPGLAKACCLLTVDDSFDLSARKVKELLGQEVSPNTIERLAHQIGGKVLQQQDRQLDAFRQDREPPPAQVHPPRLYVTMDGTTVHEKDGWHDAKAGRLYWEDDRCEPHSYTLGRQTFGWHLWLAATFIVDWYHANEHIWDCGKALFGEGTTAMEKWSTQREAWLWEGQTRWLTDDLAEQIKDRRGAKRESLEALRRYILTNEWEMRYDVFRAKGYDIGSGQVEAACKHVIGKRLKQSGMIWKRPGSSTTLAMRTAWLNGEWDSLWASKPMAN